MHSSRTSGAASSGVSFTFIDKVTGACKIHFSPANTSPDFTDYDDNGLYFRTAPSDVLQGALLGDLISVLLAPYDSLGAFAGRIRREAPEDPAAQARLAYRETTLLDDRIADDSLRAERRRLARVRSGGTA